VHEINLAEHLLDRFGRSGQLIRFTNSGTEAVMLSVKLARAMTGRCKLAKCEGAYHGAYDYVEPNQVSIAENWNATTTPAPMPYSLGTPQSILDAIVMLPYNDIENSLRILEHNRGDLAGVIIEPIANRSGLIAAKREYLAVLRAFCTAKKLPLIFDEVISFRIGVGGAQTDYDVFPDLTVLGKIIGGGFPIGAVLGTPEIMSALDPRKGHPAVPSTGTFNANPISMIAGLVAMESYDASEIARLNRICEEMCIAMRGILKRLDETAQILNCGSLFRLHLTEKEVRDYQTGKPTKAMVKRLSEIQRQLFHAGFLISKLCAGNISTVISSPEIDRFLNAFEIALVATQRTRNRSLSSATS
jgi:glutamate-1-semialdehyde 2,1-aminomutase